VEVDVGVLASFQGRGAFAFFVESDTDKRAIARDAGATGWMVKPFDPDRLIATIRKVSP